MNIEVTPLPGIGVRKDFALRDGRRIGVVSQRDGKLSLIVSKADDPDATLAELPLTTEEAGAYFSQFYEPVASDHVTTWTPEYASAIVRHTFDRSSPIAQYATIPRAFVFIQRINLGLYALLGDLRATGNYRRVAVALWPFANAAPSTPLGAAEAAWLARRHG